MITREMTIEEIFKSHPQKSQRLAQVMSHAGLQCAGCSAATWETLEAGMYGHGMDDDDINDLVEDLNAILEESSDPSTITLTERAAKKFMAILKEEGKESWGMRFGERAAGCSGFEYFLDFSEKPQSDDLTLDVHGVAIHIQQKASHRLMGSVIDYVDGLQGAGFKISNPNARSSCGCGSSHNY